jgi:hypothetical protein
MTRIFVFCPRLPFFGSVIVGAALLLCSPAMAQAVAPAAPQAAPAAANPGGANAITQAAVQQGAMACASRINQVTNFLGFNDQAGATL